MRCDPVRRRAWEVLRAVERGGPLDSALDSALDSTDDPRGRAFLAELVKGTLRWRGRYDALINHFARKPRRIDKDARVVLRLGLHQLIGCSGVPAYAAVDQSVSLARAVRGNRIAPFVNGLLQSAARHLAAAGGDPVEACLELYPDPGRDPAGHLAARHSYPRWLVERWLERFGPEGCARLLECGNRRPPLCLRVLPPADPRTVHAELEQAGLEPRPGTLSARALLLDAPPDRDGLRRLLAGRADLLVQDEAVQAATEWLAAGLRGDLVDICAAPGGKTFHLRAGGELTPRLAMDFSPQRLRLVAETLARLPGPPLPLVAADAMLPPLRPGSCANVLLDGPCTGTGVLRHHPEGRWRVDARSVERSAERLGGIAAAAADLLAPGGRLLYCTCSLEPQENNEVVARLLDARDDLEIDPEAPPFAGDGDPGGPGRWWLPHRDGADGFYAARLRRKDGS